MMLIYFQILIIAIFFVSFIVFCKKTGLSYWAPSSMSVFFDGIFFVGKENFTAMTARIVLLLVIPASFLLRFDIEARHTYQFILIAGAWAFLMYCYYYKGEIKPGRIKSSAIFSEIFFAKRAGLRGLALWSIRVIYVVGITFHFLS